MSTGLLRKSSGFTLVELAVVMAIIALLLGMLIVPLGTQMDQQRASETNRQMDQIREAVIGFATATGRLPCPATATTASGVAGAGLENKPGIACGILEGVVPWATLGVPEADAWGRRFTYRVTSAFADDATGGLSATFLLTDGGDITITDGSATIAQNIPAVIVSHGKNGTGSYGSDGGRFAVGTANELENNNGNATFISRTNATDFDDLVVWVSPNVLKSRMVAANRLP
jgi:prepilin-type N-terminal cleavage/methylation domain-containing protein